MKAVNIVGCSLAGITSAILLKEKGFNIKIFETRNHIGGNCYDSNVSGTLVHNYGPRLFHASSKPCEAGDVPFYPIPFGEGLERYSKYKQLADKEQNTWFVGRLATYTYLDMWMTVKQAMLKCQKIDVH